MPKTEFKMDKGLARLTFAIDPKKMDATVKRHLRRATRLNGKVVEREARKVIQSGASLERNAALTQAIKGEDKPLVGLTGEMFRAITSQSTGDVEVFVGVLRTDEAFNIARIVNDGAKIKVTKAMRGMFFMLYKASIGDIDPSELTGRAAELWKRNKEWYPLKQSTTTIVIPSRPFMELAFKSSGVHKEVQGNWTMALRAAMRERAQK